MAIALIVDDAKIMRLNLKRMLEKLGHIIIAEADNGYDAVLAYKRHKPDFVTMDITMPNKNGVADGVDAVEKIKEIDENAKIIMVTSHGEEQEVRRAIKAGAKNYILKPIKIDVVKQTLLKLGIKPVNK